MLGILAKLYRNTGSYGSPTWVSIDLISDLSIKPAWKEGDATTRSSRAELMSKTTLAIPITGKVRVDLTDAGYLAIVALFLSDTPADLLCLDGPSTTNGVTGFRADFHCSELGEEQNKDGVLFRDFKLVPGLGTNLPKSVAVSGAAPVFTAI